MQVQILPISILFICFLISFLGIFDRDVLLSLVQERVGEDERMRGRMPTVRARALPRARRATRPYRTRRAASCTHLAPRT